MRKNGFSIYTSKGGYYYVEAKSIEEAVMEIRKTQPSFDDRFIEKVEENRYQRYWFGADNKWHPMQPSTLTEQGWLNLGTFYNNQMLQFLRERCNEATILVENNNRFKVVRGLQLHEDQTKDGWGFLFLTPTLEGMESISLTGTSPGFDEELIGLWLEDEKRIDLFPLMLSETQSYILERMGKRERAQR